MGISNMEEQISIPPQPAPHSKTSSSAGSFDDYRRNINPQVHNDTFHRLTLKSYNLRMWRSHRRNRHHQPYHNHRC